MASDGATPLRPQPTRSPRRVVRLERGDIVAAAVASFNLGELDSLTMRRLAHMLDVSPMALYAHISDKDELLDEVLAHVLAGIDLPSRKLKWQNWMAEFAAQLHRVLCDHPVLLTRYLQRPVGVRPAVVRMEAALGVLNRAGFCDEECVDIYGSLVAVTLGFTALEVSRRGGRAPRPNRSIVGVDEGHEGFWPAYFSTLPSAEFPHLARVRPDLALFASQSNFSRVVSNLLAAHHAPRGKGGPKSAKAT
ncbi:MAG: transcriptional regulator, TetR family [Ilumatobacteraceae bacterium]|nr:transcriptional regulator, TetR family [Ilumatobacteraceae bacterium]